MLQACGGGGANGLPPAAALPTQLALTVPARAEPGASVALLSSLGAMPTPGLTLRWDFGDGGSSAESLPSHSFAAPGDYTVTLTVSNGAGQSVTGRGSIQVGRFAMVADRLCSGADGSGWCWQAPLPDVQPVDVVRFSSADLGVIAGRSGWFEITTDGGKTWTRRPRQAIAFADAAMVDASNGWALGADFQAVHRTRDAGRTWERKPVNLLALANAGARLRPLGGERLMVAAPPSLTVAEGFITHDGGATWALAPSPSTSVSPLGEYWSVVSVPSLRGFPPDTFVYSRFSDFGRVREPVGELPGRCRAPILLVDEQRVFAPCRFAGTLLDQARKRPQIFSSVDGGRSWAELAGEIPEAQGFGWEFRDVALDARGQGLGVFIDTFAASPRTELLRASDGATRWQPIALPAALSGYTLPEQTVLDSRTLWLGGPDGRAWLSDDAGQTWRVLSNAAEPGRPQRLTRDGGRGLLAEHFEFEAETRRWRSTDQGQNWYRLPGGRGPDPFNWVASLWFFDARRGLALLGDGKLRATDDGGRTWAERPGDSSSANRFGSTGALQFPSAASGWLIHRDELKRSTNGGLTWSRAEVPAEMARIADLHFVTATRGWAVSKEGGLFTTGDGGQRWTAAAQPAGEGLAVRRVRFANERTGVLVVSDRDVNTLVYHSTDGGQTWRATNFNRGGGGVMSQLVYADARNVWMSGTRVVGESLWRSRDAGATWQPAPVPVDVSVDNVHFVDAQNGWLTTSGALLATTDGGATWSRQAEGHFTVGLYAMFWLDTKTGWLGGGSAAILATATGGR